MKSISTPLLDNNKILMEKLNSGAMTPDEVIAAYEWAVANKDGLYAEIGKMKIAQIKEMVNSYRAKTKADWVEACYDAIRKHFILVSMCLQFDHHTIMNEDAAWKSTLEQERKVVKATTAEQIAKHAADLAKRRADRTAHVEAVKAALKDPKTLKDFSFIKEYREGGLDALTPTEQATLDRLVWEKRRADRKANEANSSRIDAVDLVDVEVTLHKTKHTQKGHDLYVVTLSDWIEKNDFEDLCQIAHQLSGNYSDYSANGAIPGFTFKNQANAEKFIEVFSNDISTAEERAERKRQSLLNTKDRLIAIADAMIRDADEDLNRPRKENTARRAAQAESVIRRNLAWKALAKTLASVANTLGDGEHPLDGIRHRVHIESLVLLINRMRWANPKCEDRDTLILNAKLPGLYLYRNDAIEMFRKLKPLKNTIRVCDHLLKRIRETPDDGKITFTDSKEREYAVKIFQKLGDGCAWYLADALRERRRLERMGILTSNELRHALRTFWSHVVAPDEIPAKDRLIRDLIGRDLPGFFPTPADLAETLVEMADIPAGAVVIEPSAGKGDLADLIAERHPDAALTCIEQNSSLVAILKMEHDNVIHGDWLEQTAMADRIIMNPPFEQDADIDHVRHAYSRLNPGGRLVAIMSSGAVQRTIGKAVGFRDWLREIGASVTENPEGSFLSAFRSTGVNTITVVIDRPAQAVEITNQAAA